MVWSWGGDTMYLRGTDGGASERLGRGGVGVAVFGEGGVRAHGWLAGWLAGWWERRGMGREMWREEVDGDLLVVRILG